MTYEMEEFDWEFHVGEGTYVADELREKARKRMLALARGHDDMIGASVAVERPALRETAFVYEARAVAYIRPDHIVAVHVGGSAERALSAALDAVERQVRELRDKLRKPWQQPDADDAGMR